LTTLPSPRTITVEHIRGGAYRLTSTLALAQPIDVVFSFFSDAHNLETLTPPWLKFRVLTPAPIAIERGTKIDYRLRVHGLPIRWTSEINVWEPPNRFADRQVRGPYRRWEHEHTFDEADDGTIVGDRVEFAVRGGRLPGQLASADVRRIFAYRRKRLRELFG
jgi:ligand-binding SRPBCC domain-containing protein